MKKSLYTATIQWFFHDQQGMPRRLSILALIIYFLVPVKAGCFIAFKDACVEGRCASIYLMPWSGGHAGRRVFCITGANAQVRAVHSIQGHLVNRVQPYLYLWGGIYAGHLIDAQDDNLSGSGRIYRPTMAFNSLDNCLAKQRYSDVITYGEHVWQNGREA